MRPLPSCTTTTAAV